MFPRLKISLTQAFAKRVAKTMELVSAFGSVFNAAPHKDLLTALYGVA